MVPTETPQFFTSTVAAAALLETLMAFVVADADDRQLLGAHIIGPRASDMIAECVLAMEFGASAEDSESQAIEALIDEPGRARRACPGAPPTASAPWRRPLASSPPPHL